MADGMTQLCDLCKRLRSSSFLSTKSKNMSNVVHLILASLTGVAVALIATYLPPIWRPVWIPSFESYAPGFNLVLAPEKALLEKSPLEGEALQALNVALEMLKERKRDKALKLFKQATALSPHHPDILLHYGEFLEEDDVIHAEHLYARALAVSPGNSRALANRGRTLPKVRQLDQEMLDKIDSKRDELFRIPKGSLAMKRAVTEAYYQHIYHSNAIEGNTMTLSMTRAIVETRMAVPGKSILEHNEVLGLDEAMKFVNGSLLQKQERVTVDDILEIHRRVLGHAHPLEAGRYRKTQVYVSDHVPPSPEEVEKHMEEFNSWLLSREPEMLHPIEFAALAHYKLVFIHPFTDGNGRTARLLMNSVLMRAGFPPVIIRFQDRYEYYEHLNHANHGDVRPFIRFVARCTHRTIEEYLSATTIYPVGHLKHPELTDSHEESAQ
ncbi:protein adenylyltransferase Fic-like [Acropora millepora]|uniref:protein adenylyltransferase Fic-like n=1 Tax=Acropora millepora TaxID=45264 RepID=UPI001CF277AC|nr:protein adenylyltransferase Fic-like [Acropora millepora]